MSRREGESERVCWQGVDSVAYAAHVRGRVGAFYACGWSVVEPCNPSYPGAESRMLCMLAVWRARRVCVRAGGRSGSLSAPHSLPHLGAASLFGGVVFEVGKRASATSEPGRKIPRRRNRFQGRARFGKRDVSAGRKMVPRYMFL